MDDRLALTPGPDRLRIAVISMHTSPTASLGHSANGGLNVYVRRVCEALSECGVATDVYTRVPEGTAPHRQRIARLSRVIHVPAGRESLGKYELVEETGRFASAIARRAASEGISYDLVYSHYWLSGLAAEALVTELDRPWAHTAHTLGLVKNRHLARGAAAEPAERLQAEAHIASRADLIVASTEFERQDLVDLCGARPDRVRVIPPGVDLQTFHPLARADSRRRLGLGSVDDGVVLFAGRLERLKGVEIVLRSFAAVSARNRRPLRLVIAGEDSQDAAESEKKRLQDVAAVLGIEDRVSFVGPVEHSRLRRYYSAADVCMMPSYSESFGLVALEAQACGCPVIAADVSGLASVVRNAVTGYLVAGDEPSDFAERLGSLLDDPETAQQMGRRGILLAQRFSWDRTRDLLLEQFEMLAGSQSGVQAIARHE